MTALKLSRPLKGALNTSFRLFRPTSWKLIQMLKRAGNNTRPKTISAVGEIKPHAQPDLTSLERFPRFPFGFTRSHNYATSSQPAEKTGCRLSRMMENNWVWERDDPSISEGSSLIGNLSPQRVQRVILRPAPAAILLPVQCHTSFNSDIADRFGSTDALRYHRPQHVR